MATFRGIRRGEPLLIPYLYRLIDFSSSLGILPGLVTNGELIPDNYLRLIQSGLGLVWISILSSCPRVNDSITRRPGSFHHKIKAIRTLRQAAKNNEILLMANMVIEPRNYTNIYDTMKMLANEGISVAYVEEVVNTGHAKDNPSYFLNENQRKISLDQIKKSQKDFPALITITRTLSRPIGERHLPSHEFLNITPDGFLTKTESMIPSTNLSIVNNSLTELINLCN